ncbi:MAG TPA: glycosyltransferase family 39 protein [Gemmataceae bacterium]|nr:glycosyltransferase family 39 protein [Gemmataceae bacterium]
MSSLATLPEAAPRQSSSLSAWLRLPLQPAERRWSAVLLLSVLCAFLFFYGLNAGELYRTEGLRAIIAAEFLRSGNWIVPTLYGEPLFTKPPGMYAAIALCSWPFGVVTDWSARIPSAVAATATVFLWYWYFTRQLGRRAGLIAAVILPLSLMWLDKAPSAEIDMLQVAWVSAAILFFLRALEAEEERSPGLFFWWLAAMLCVAGGFLTKWTAPAFFYGTAVPLLWWRGRLRLLWGWPHLTGLVVAVGLCLAWVAAAVAMTNWEIFYNTVSREALMRLSPSHHHRPYPWGETLAQPWLILATNLPWSIFALPALRPRFAGLWDERGRRLLQALHCWAWPNLLFWTVIPEHAIRHSAPLFPAISGLAAMVWIRWKDEASPGRRSLSSFILRPSSFHLIGFLAVWLVVKVVHVHLIVPVRSHGRQPQAKAQQLAALVPPGATLYLFKVKDEGIMFYYGRPVRRVNGPDELPSQPEPLYGILTEQEWRQWNAPPHPYPSPPKRGRGEPESYPSPLKQGRGEPEFHPSSLEQGRGEPEFHPSPLKRGRGESEFHPSPPVGGEGLGVRGRPIEVIAHLQDEQGDPMVLVRVWGGHP